MRTKTILLHFLILLACLPVYAGGDQPPSEAMSGATADADSHSASASNFPATAVSDGPTVDVSAAQRLQALLQPVDRFSARFEQKLTAADGYLLQNASGQLIVARPGMIRWISEAPLEQWVISNSETLWIYDPDLEQVTIRAFQQDVLNTPAVLLVGELDNLDRLYRVEARNTPEAEQSAPPYSESFILTPREGDQLYSKLVISFSANKPAAMELWDSLGQKTEIRFHSVDLSPELDNRLFEFEPPPGVDIIQGQQSH